MNYFAHGRSLLDAPYVLAGTAVPDWLSVVDRRVRVRTKHAEPFLSHPDPCTAGLAEGIARHHKDDAWFHETTAFVELNASLTVLLRDALPRDEGFRPAFLGHLLVELLLDAALIEEDPGRLQAYYAALGRIDPLVIQDAVNQMAPRPASHLAAFIHRFSEVRFLFDYLDDGKLVFRLNQVLSRVGLAPLPDEIRRVLPAARQRVAARKSELLTER